MRLIPAALVLAFTIYCVLDVVRSDSTDVRGLPKTFWVVVILIAPLVGGVAWLLAGRPRSTRLPGTARLTRPRPSVLGPDDDPDFLRTIDRPGPVAPPTPLRPDERPDERPGAGPTRDEPSATSADQGGAASGAEGGTDPGARSDGDDDSGAGTAAGTDDRHP